MLLKSLNNLFIEIIGKATGVFVSAMEGKEDGFVAEECANFAAAVCQNMQPLYKVGIAGLALYLNFSQLLRYGKFFINLPLEKRTKILDKWSGSLLGPKRDFVKLFLNLSILAYYDSEDVLEKMGVDTREYLKIQRLYND
jgi:hypothetical protein